jgi:hypothetical protein
VKNNRKLINYLKSVRLFRLLTEEKQKTLNDLVLTNLKGMKTPLVLSLKIELLTWKL